MSAATSTCPSCGIDVASDARFCSSCGTPLVMSCPGCGAAASGRFCAQCGTSLSASPAGVAPAAAAPLVPVAERRVTSVLFADLVGFTPLSEARDSEDVRDLLSRYFAVARTVIGRFGGTVEKFIGDAVMAVWGVPTAQEDDAERAVRAGIELIDAVTALGDEIGIPELAMRVGIVTGEVAVTLGATGEGMVAGDAVNTAARVQSVAGRNEVWVDDTTRRLTTAAIVYSDAGRHELKGKAEPLTLFAVQQVVAAVGGAQRVDGLEAPFVGRDREMRLVKELFHAAIEESRPRLVAVTGLPGVGKSRLGWEFEKYIDGLSSTVRWHRGRCLSYGEGVAFHALTEMVRSRLGILDGDEPATIATKLDAGLAQWVSDADERSWLTPRLATLVGGDVSSALAREDLFAAWQVFFERLVDENASGVALLIEDLQWADDGLLDFVDYLLMRSNAPVFVLALSRPEIDERRPGWSSGRRAIPIHLEPLASTAMENLVDGLVVDLSKPLRDALVERSEGIPLYAVETVRSLIDRDVVIPQEGRYVLADGADPDIGESAPTSLHTLIAARLDTLTPDERRTVQDASVLGLAFPRAALAAVNASAAGIADLDAALDALVRKEILVLDSDPRSPERGQFRFVQAMVRTVAYETLARRDRKARHLVAAKHLAAETDTDVYAAVTAAHYLDAYAAEPEADDAAELARQGVTMLDAAARRALVLGVPGQAVRHYARALEFADDPQTRSLLGIGAAESAVDAGDPAAAAVYADGAYNDAERAELRLEAARALAVFGAAKSNQGQGHDVPGRLIPAFEALPDIPETIEVRTQLAQNIARAYFSSIIDLESATLWAEQATSLAEASENWPLLSECLGGYGAILMTSGRPTMGLGLLRVALDVARDHSLPRAELIPLNNLASFQAARDVSLAREYVEQGLLVARRLGVLDAYLHGTAAFIYWLCGSWDEIQSVAAEIDLDQTHNMTAVMGSYIDLVRLARGEPLSAPAAGHDDNEIAPQAKAALLACQAMRALAAGDVGAAEAAAAEAVDVFYSFGALDDDFPTYWALLLDVGSASGGSEAAHRWLRAVSEAPRGQVPTFLRATLPYFRARLAVASDPSLVDGDYAEATIALRAFGAPYWLGRCLLDHAQFLIEENRSESVTAMLDEAERIFISLKATPWVEKTRRAMTLAVR